jgi:carboxyl-terminal processing protease
LSNLVSSRWRRLGVAGAIVLILGLGVLSGVLLDRQVLLGWVPCDSCRGDSTLDWQLIEQAAHTIDQAYVDRAAVQSRPLTYGAVGGMVDALADTGHSRFLSPELLQEEHNVTQGQFEGIGAEVEMRDGHVVIVTRVDGSPAQQAGLQPGDLIVRVDGADLTGLPLDQVVGRVLGPAGTQVTLTITNPTTGQTRDVTLVRAHIKVHNVTWQRLPGTEIAHVRITAFSHGVTNDLQEALNAIKQQGLTGVILDLRNNPGGLLDEAVGTASQFLESGNVLMERDAQGHTTPLAVKGGGVGLDMPLAVLVNSGSASASEIVAGALQDAARATLVGETTFGTGTVLQEFPLSDGSALLLAIQEWLTPEGRVIWHQGITPDVVVSLPENAAPLLPAAETDMTAAELQANGDLQLLRALDLLAPPQIVTCQSTAHGTCLAAPDAP